MSDGRKRKSGAQYKKLREEKKLKEEDVLSKTRRLDSFFTPKSSGSDGYQKANK